MHQPKYAISTQKGDFFDFTHPERYDYDIITIAHSLANICRYGGHSNKFYSVAEHSVLVSRVVPEEFALVGLLHDASEAFVGDMPTPLKAMCQSYRTIEDRVQEAIAEYYRLPYPFPKEIKHADKAVYKAERGQITSQDDNVWHTEIPPADVQIRGYPPREAKRLFLERYEELSGQRDQVVRRAAA